MTALRELAERWNVDARAFDTDNQFDRIAAKALRMHADELLQILDAEGDGSAVGGLSDAQIDWLITYQSRLIINGLHPEDARLWMRSMNISDFEVTSNPVESADEAWQDHFAPPDGDISKHFHLSQRFVTRVTTDEDAEPSVLVMPHPQPVRSSAVSDADMDRCERMLTACTCHADFKDRDMVDPQCCACDLGSEVIDTFRAMRAALEHFAKSLPAVDGGDKRDAERYRWLLDNATRIECENWNWWSDDEVVIPVSDRIDAAIKSQGESNG